MPGTVTLLDPQGSPRDVPADQAADYVNRGWREQTHADVLRATTEAANQADYGGAHGAIGAVGAGLLRGATLGGSDVLARAIGGEDAAQTLRGLREQNPGLSIAGDIAGAVAPTLLSGGAAFPAGLVGRAGTATAAGAGGGFAGALAGGVAEGALFGVGQGASELALSQDPLTLEHAASTLSSNLLYGALAGGVAGTAVHGVAEGLAAAKGAIDDALIARSGERAMKIADELEAKAAAEPASITPETDVSTLDRAGLKAAREQELERIEGARAPEKRQFVNDLGEFYDDMASQKLSKVVTGTSDAEARRAGAALRNADMQIRRLTDNEVGLADRPDRALAALQTQRQALNDIRDWMDEEMGQWQHKVREGAPQLHAELMGGKIEGYVGSALTPEGRHLAVQQEMARRFGGRVVNEGGLVHLDYPENISFENWERLQKAIERNASLQEHLARITSDPISERLMQIESAEHALGGRTSAPAPVPATSPIGHVLHAAAHAAGPLGAVATTAVKALGGLRKAAGAMAERAGKAASSFLDVAGSAASKAAPPAPPLATKVLAGLRYSEADEEAPAKESKALPELYKARTDEIKRQVQIAPDGSFHMRPEARQKMAARLAGLGAVDPVTADRLESAGALRIAWLASQIPRRPDIAGVQVGPDTWHPSDMEMRAFARKAAAAEDPHAVLDRVVHGQVTPEDVMAMKAVFPEMLQSFVRAVSVELPTLRKTLPYERKLALSMFSGVPVDPALDPRIVAVLQGHFAAEPGSEGGTAAPKPQPQFGSLKKSPGAPTPAQVRAQGAHI